MSYHPRDVVGVPSLTLPKISYSFSEVCDVPFMLYGLYIDKECYGLDYTWHVSSFLFIAYLPFYTNSFFFSISAFPGCKLIFVSSTAHQFTNRDIALMLGVSQRTVERRISQLQMSNMSRYSNIEDDMLDSFVQRIITNFPRSGKWALRFPFVFIVSLSFRNPQNSTSRRTLNSSFAVLLRHENNRGLSSITRHMRSKVKVEEFLEKN